MSDRNDRFVVLALRSYMTENSPWGVNHNAEAWTVLDTVFKTEESAEKSMLDQFRAEREEREDGCTLDESCVHFRMLDVRDGIVHGIEMVCGEPGTGETFNWKIVRMKEE